MESKQQSPATVYENVRHGDASHERGFLVLRSKTIVYYTYAPEDVLETNPMEAFKISWNALSKHNISKASSPQHYLILYCKSATTPRLKTDRVNPYAFIFCMQNRQELERIEEDIISRQLEALYHDHHQAKVAVATATPRCVSSSRSFHRPLAVSASRGKLSPV